MSSTPRGSSMRRWCVVAFAVLLVVSGRLARADAGSEAPCAALSIVALNLERCVVPGDQPELDAGHVVRVDLLSTATGHWIAGHRTSHGATFAALVQLRLGDLVSYGGESYRVDEYRVIDLRWPGDVRGWTKSSAPTLVLQTSRDDTTVHLWRAVATMPTSSPGLDATSPSTTTLPSVPGTTLPAAPDTTLPAAPDTALPIEPDRLFDRRVR